MPKLIGKGLATSVCHNLANNNMKSASRSAPTAATKAFSHTTTNSTHTTTFGNTTEVNTQPISIPNNAMHEKIDQHCSFVLDSTSQSSTASLSMSPLVRNGPASLAFADTKKTALHLGEDQEAFAKLLSSQECILDEFAKAARPASPAIASDSPKREVFNRKQDPFVFDNFLSLNDSSPTSSLKSSKSFSRKRRSTTSNLAENDVDPYPTSKVHRSGMKKSPSRYHLASLNDQAEASNHDKYLPSTHTSSSSLATSEQENLTPHRSITPSPSWGQFADLDPEF